MKKSSTINTFQDGLVQDLNPAVVPNTMLTNALNATFITMNGNENSLQNDMGNGRVETAFLPEGYVPLGTAELGGIIYIVSYNPLIDKCQIGSFPSPERNITSSEIQAPQVEVTNSQFQITSGNEKGRIINTILKVKLLSDPDSEDGLYKLNPGDKYTIYSTNQGITNNKGQISDVGNKLHIIDTEPRNVTIHVVSIGDDGKIVYLDDSLKWNGSDGKPADYYIKECEGDDNVQTDIDQYRSLVSSAYNIFNSKVSGELALLFELKVIDSFTITWDAEVTGEDKEKTAKITFNVNYTSEHKDINLKYILLTDSSATEGLTCPVKTGDYCEVKSEKERVNDGTDPDIIVTVGDFKYDAEKDLSEYIWNYELTPSMSFGYLDYLAIRGSINFSEIGSGKTEVDEWRYYIQESNFYINWGLSAYPEKNKKIDRVIMTFIPFDKISKYTVITDTKTEPCKDFVQHIISGRNSYSGYFQEIINFDERSDEEPTILKNYLYLVDICVQYGKEDNWEYRHTYKWLYTTGQWNKEFVDESISDFSTLNLDNVLTFNADFSTKDTINPIVYNTDLNLGRTFDKENQPYEAMGASITTVNYKYEKDSEEEDNGTFNKEDANINTSVITRCTSYPELFEFEKQNGDSYEFKIKSSSISTSNLTPTSDRPSSIADAVLPKIAEPTQPSNCVQCDEELASAIKNVLNNNITDETCDEKLVDSFTSTIKTDNDSFSIVVYGAIFSRINADLTMKLCTVSQQIRPFLYYTDDYAKMGLKSQDDFDEYFSISWKDGGGGDPFEFTMESSNGSYYHSNKNEWDPDDTFDKQYWWDKISPYTNYLNSWMCSKGGCFQIVLWKGCNGKKACWNGNDIKDQYSLWARSTEDLYMPINCFTKKKETDEETNGDDRKALANIVTNIYLQLYYVDTNVQPKNLTVVDNINYMTNYTETWSIVVSSTLTISNILSDVKLIQSDGNTKSLKELKDTCDNITNETDKVINTTNITRSELKQLELPDQTISHIFQIINADLYNVYENAKNTSIPAIMTLSTEDDWQLCSPKTQNKLYIYDEEKKDFIKVDGQNSFTISVNGTVTTKEVEGNDQSIQRLKYTKGNKFIGYKDSAELQSCKGKVKMFDIFDKSELDGTQIKFSQSNMLSITAEMLLENDSKGHTYSYIRKNPNKVLTIDNAYFEVKHYTGDEIDEP